MVPCQPVMVYQCRNTRTWSIWHRKEGNRREGAYKTRDLHKKWELWHKKQTEENLVHCAFSWPLSEKDSSQIFSVLLMCVVGETGPGSPGWALKGSNQWEVEADEKQYQHWRSRPPSFCWLCAQADEYETWWLGVHVEELSPAAINRNLHEGASLQCFDCFMTQISWHKLIKWWKPFSWIG